MAENMKTRSWNYDFFIVFILFIISILLRIYNYHEQPVQGDELIYASYTYSILSHNWMWPKEFMGANPPLLPYILAIATYLFEGGLDVFRIISIFFGSLTVCVIYFLGKSLYNRRVGILAATLLCFCSYHILHSRVVMLEAIWIFLAYLSMYYFWRSYNEENGIKYALLSGVFLGLALDTKYNALLLYPSFALFILWTKKRGWLLGWKYLIEKKYLLLFFVSILIFLPVLIIQYMKGVDPFFFNFFGRGQDHWAGYRLAGGFDIFDMVRRGFNNYIDMVVDGHSATSLSLPWLPAFYIAASLLLIITLLYSLYLLFKSQNSGSFLMITFIIFYAFIALFGIKFQHYLLWGLPLFFIMLSYLIVVFVEKIGLQIKNHVFSLLDWMKIFTLILACIFIFSYIVVGTIAPSVSKWNIGATGYEKQVLHIKNTINPGDCIVTTKVPIILYYLDKYDFNTEENNIHVFWLYKTKISLRREGVINLKLIKLIKPRFLIIHDPNFYAWASVREEIVILENYKKISTITDIALYERMD